MLKKAFTVICVLIIAGAFAQNKKIRHGTEILIKKDQLGCPAPITFEKFMNNSFVVTDTVPCSLDTVEILATDNPWLDQTLNYAPCLLITATPSIQNNLSSGNMYVYEGSDLLYCEGSSSSCVPNGVDWSSFTYSGLIPSQTHNIVFCRSSAFITTTTVSVQNCWSGVTYAGPVVWSSTSPTCFSLTVTANTNIGTGSYASDIPAAIRNTYNGHVKICPSAMGIGWHWVKYSWNSGTGCVQTATDTFYIQAPCSNGINTLKENAKIKLHPNPFSNLVYFDRGDINFIHVYNVLGEKIKTFIKPGKFIDLTEQEEGVYLLRIILSEGKEASEKILKE